MTIVESFYLDWTGRQTERETERERESERHLLVVKSSSFALKRMN